MPITPKYANVIAFFGGNSFARLESMLRYYSTVLNQDVWQDFLFILATPGTQSVAALPADLPTYIRDRCCDGCGDPRFIIYQQTADKIHGMYHDDNLCLHLICDDFETGLYPAEAPSTLVHILRQATGNIDITPYYYFMLHQNSDEKIRRQRQLAQKLCEDEERGNVLFPYLLSHLRNDNSLAQPEQLWRAVMCEILVICNGSRHINVGTVSSLGYTSLNADEKELFNLRRHCLLELLHNYCTASYPEGQAWQMLLQTSSAIPEGQNTLQAQEAILQWLQERIRQDILNPSPDQLNNFRVLSGINQLRTPDSLLNMAMRFYKMNLHSQFAAMTEQENKKPEYLSAQKYMHLLLSNLSKQPNLCRFPRSVIKLITDCLAVLCRHQPRTAIPDYPNKPFWQKTDDYMLKCSQLAEEAARTRVVEELIPAYAQAYGEMFTYLGRLLEQTYSIESEINKLMLPSDRSMDLQHKYPNYFANLKSTLNRLQESPFGSVMFYHSATLSPNMAAIQSALQNADEAVHSKMDSGFRSSFISAIEHEFDSADAMNAFLGNYLNNKYRMFRNTLVPLGIPVITYFSNNQLANSTWASEHGSNTFFVENDNVERLDYFILQGGRYNTLSDYLSDANQYDKSNLFFRLEQADGASPFSLPNAQTAPLPQTDVPADARLPRSSVSAAQEQAAQNVSSLRLSEDRNQLFLTWNWSPDVRFYQVKINETSFDINSNNYYHTHGMNVTDKLVPGKNHIVLCELNGSVIEEADFRGPQKYIDYKKTMNALHVTYSPVAIPSLVVQETLRSADQNGNERKRYFYYPLATVDPSKGQNVIHYEGLSFRGEWDLVSIPTDRFCQYAPRLNANL